MSFNFSPLWKLLIDQGMKKTDLVDKLGISSSTLAKMGKNEYVSMEVIERICNHLNCQISDVVVYVRDNKNIK